MSLVLSELSPEQIRDIEWLVQRCADADGVSPLNESARLGLKAAGSHRITHYLLPESTNLVGYASYDHNDGSLQLCIDPEHRNFGLGTGLISTVAEQQQMRSCWAFGSLPAARAVAARMGMVASRQLLKMTCPLPEAIEPSLAPGTIAGSFFENELDDLLKVNARAFADHPEQGSMTREDFEARLGPKQNLYHIISARAWPPGAEWGDWTFIGFHWMKVEDTLGEVYVLAVDPSWEGKGVGRSLLQLGLEQMRTHGVRWVLLYVEAANQKAVNLYTSMGFEIARTDTSYTFLSPGQEA